MSNNAIQKGEDVYYDPYLREIVKSPYPIYQRLREEAPLYYNKEYNFYALSRYEDVRKGLADHKTFSSAKGGILEQIQQNVAIPPGIFISTDQPVHTAYRQVVQRIFTPKRMLGLEQQVREITQGVLDRLVGRDEFDFIADIGAQVPMRVIGTLLGIPEEQFQAVREAVDSMLATEEGKPIDYGEDASVGMIESFAPYIEWRKSNLSDDITSELLGVEFTDEKGVQRKLTDEELLNIFCVLAGAGNETTNKLIGWMGKLLAENPDQRKKLIADPSLIPDAIEEILRIETIGPHIARYVTQDVEYYGQAVPAGSAILMIAGSANRDPRAFADPDRFDITRERAAHCTFGYGIHTCIGNVLARMEGRIVLEELLKRFPHWDVDMNHAEMLTTSSVRGWETLPAYINARGAEAIKEKVRQKIAEENSVSDNAPHNIDGEWTVTIKGPTGPMPSTLNLATKGGALGGSQSGDGVTTPIDEISYENGNVVWVNKIQKPMKLKLQFKGKVEGKTMTGKVKVGFIGSYPFTAVKEK